MTAPGCAYLVSRYPSVTHTFVAGEVRALRATGMRIETFSVRKVPQSEPLSELDTEEWRATRALLPASPGTLLGCHVRAAVRHPLAYVRTLAAALRMAHAGGRARLWQLFYFAEAIILWAWLRDAKLTHIHVHHANVSADVALLTCRFANSAGAGRPWTWSLTLHGPTEFSDVEGHKLEAKVADAAAVVCISDFARSQVVAVVDPRTLEKVHTVRCGIDLDVFRPRSTRPTAPSAQILCLGALSRRKGHVVLLDALKLVLERIPEARLIIVGDGAERAFLEARTKANGIGRAVQFAGAVGHDRVASFYEATDVFCLPSFAEGVPTVLMEAMAMEIPVVATNIMGVPELVEDGVSGLLVPPARPDLLADALVRLLGDPDLRTRMGRRGRERVLQDYDRSISSQGLQRVLGPLST